MSQTPLRTVPIASNGLEGWTSCCDASVTYYEDTLICKACFEAVAPLQLDEDAGVILGGIVASVIEGTLTPEQGVAEQHRLIGR